MFLGHASIIKVLKIEFDLFAPSKSKCLLYTPFHFIDLKEKEVFIQIKLLLKTVN